MTEHETCKGCQWNNYPECHGTILDNGNYMNIENKRITFNCGQKNIKIMTDLSIKNKSALELKIELLEERIKTLEEVKE